MFALFLSIVSVLFGFSVYYGLTKAPFLNNWMSRRWGGRQTARAIYIQRLIGVCSFTVPPLLAAAFFAPKILEFNYFSNPATPQVGFWLLGLAALIIPMTLLAGGKDDNLQVYPQIRDREWRLSTLVGSALSWTAYLLAYEWLFRGVLFFTALPLLGFWGATAVNVVLYALVHIPKGRLETVGAIPLGIVLCVATFHTGSIWVAFLTHVLLAFSNEWTTLYRHPDIHLKVLGVRNDQTMKS